MLDEASVRGVPLMACCSRAVDLELLVVRVGRIAGIVVQDIQDR